MRDFIRSCASAMVLPSTGVTPRGKVGFCVAMDTVYSTQNCLGEISSVLRQPRDKLELDCLKRRKEGEVHSAGEFGWRRALVATHRPRVW